MASNVVIVGGGQAAMQTVDSLRREGYEGEIALLCAEPHLPYQRPPLSKKFLAGELDEARLALRPASFYEERGVVVELANPVNRIDRVGRTAWLANGKQFHYDQLVLATGTSVRELAVPGTQLAGVHYLRTLDDSKAVAAAMQTAQRILIIGGGFIGLEAAAVARELGKDVTVVHRSDRLMSRAVSPLVSDYFQDRHEAEGVRFHLHAEVTELRGDDSVRAVVLADGTTLDADLVLVGIGVLPNVELAEGCGIACHDGITVDTHCRTSDPHVFAIGDCSNHPNSYLNRRVRLESVQNAVDQARVVAAVIAGKEKSYNEVPWFWSDQYDLKLQMVGMYQGYDDIAVRGKRESGSFSVFYFGGNGLLAVDSINRPADHMAGRKLIAARVNLSPEHAADESANLRDLIPSER